MKKIVMLATMLIAFSSVPLVAFAEESPEENRNDYPTPVPVETTEEAVEVPEAPVVIVELPTNVSPKTGEDNAVLLYVGGAAAVLAAGTVILKEKTKADRAV